MISVCLIKVLCQSAEMPCLYKIYGLNFLIFPIKNEGQAINCKMTALVNMHFKIDLVLNISEIMVILPFRLKF